MVSNEFTIREMTEADVPFGLSLGEMSGWNQVPADWLRIYRYEPQGCFVGMMNEAPVATISTTTYGTDLAWIGMMLVHPDFRRQGIATALMKHVIAWLEERGTECIKLDATPAGATVYEQLGFKREWDFHRYEKPGDVGTVENVEGLEDFQVEQFDKKAFGVDRSEWLSRLAADSKVVSQQNGYGMLRPGRLATYLGPVIAETPDLAEDLIHQLISEQHKTIFWDAPGPNTDAVELTKRFGFQPVRPLIRMWRGENLVVGNVNKQYALASPATG
ncbi:GNAT family N-acetyltransferase [Thalassoglobus sp.]|uniref:GNAT family N-acetyltransferase n=1 Tax=Thalassoglobus sp. TaxID=2795869 RepID=UPI003AA92AD1